MSVSLTESGFVVSTRQELRDELAERLKVSFGPNLKTTGPGPMSRLIDIFTEIRATDHQAWQAVYVSLDPDGAKQRPLDARVRLTGTTRQGATHSSVDGILTFASAGTMNVGDLIHNDDNDTTWELVSGPHTSAGPWPEEIAATFSAVETGPTLADAGTTWSAVTIVAGLTGFTNPTDDAEPGRNRETDAELKVRRLRELHAQGQGPLAAIQGHVQRVPNVVFARVWHNPSTFPDDADGIPFKAFNVVVETDPAVPGADLQQAIWDAIWEATGAGGEAYGTDFVGSVIDSEGVEQPSAFDVVETKDILLEITLTTSTSEDPVTPNITDVVAARVLDVAQERFELVGRDVRRMDFTGIVYDMLQPGPEGEAPEISGVDDVSVRMAISPAALANVAKLSIGIRQRADFDSANITVLEN